MGILTVHDAGAQWQTRAGGRYARQCSNTYRGVRRRIGQAGEPRVGEAVYDLDMIANADWLSDMCPGAVMREGSV